MQALFERISSRIPSKEDHVTLLKLLEEHPYSASLHTLSCRTSRLLNDVDFEERIVFAAIRANNRKKIHHFIFENPPLLIKNETEKLAFNDPVSEDLDSKQVKTPSTSTVAPIDDRITELDRQLLAEAMSAGAALEFLSELEPIEVAKKAQEIEEQEVVDDLSISPVNSAKSESDKMTRASWMETLADKSDTTDSRTIESKASFPDSKKNKEIIEHFIENEASLGPKRAEFYSPAKAAKMSLIDKTDLVSETLAKVYAAQGNVSKAISTYEKLSLLHPEKSTYFAGRIEKLKQNKTT